MFDSRFATLETHLMNSIFLMQSTPCIILRVLLLKMFHPLTPSKIRSKKLFLSFNRGGAPAHLSDQRFMIRFKLMNFGIKKIKTQNLIKTKAMWLMNWINSLKISKVKQRQAKLGRARSKIQSILTPTMKTRESLQFINLKSITLIFMIRMKKGQVCRLLGKMSYTTSVEPILSTQNQLPRKIRVLEVGNLPSKSKAN